MRLGRNAPRLLKTVRGRPHAKPEVDHEMPPSPPPSNPTKNEVDEEDYTRDPESSDEEILPPAVVEVVATSHTPFPDRRQVDEAGDQRTPCTNPLANEKRKTIHEESNDGDDAVFDEYDRSKRRKTVMTPNIHALPESKHDRASVALQNATYRTRTQLPQKYGQRERSKKFKTVELPPPPPPVEKPKFIQPRQLPAASSPKRPRAGFRVTRSSDVALHGDADVDVASPSSLLSDLSSVPDSPSSEELKALNLPVPKSYRTEIECAICSSVVSRAIREDFDDIHQQGPRLNYKWQQRFCRYHRQHESRIVWEQRGYPDINWDKLYGRLGSRTYTKHLKKILAGHTHSVYRDQLATRLEEGGILSVQQSLAGEGRVGVGVGYYGPRGEKMFTEYILLTFADELRNRSTKDPLVAAAGVSGGVSGFVQAVLVPELAVCLITDDLGSKREKSAPEVMVESGDLGELLNPEEEDDMQVVREEYEDPE